ncbi:MAG: hypothetical protein LBB10_02320 [Bifidobacteriaceae bacterium]|nr:hypothetical protein [Bifidobacteriaceae bacterium]
MDEPLNFFQDSDSEIKETTILNVIKYLFFKRNDEEHLHLRIKYNQDFNLFFDNLVIFQKSVTNRIFNMSEIVYLFLGFLKVNNLKNNSSEFASCLYNLFQIITYTLSQLNHEIIKVNNHYIVVESNSKMSQAAQLISNDDINLSLKLFEYNHFSNSLEEKKNILKFTANSIEELIKNPTLNKQLRTDYKRLVNDILDIRHTKIKVPIEDLEYWYDSTYNTVLAIIIDLEQKEIHKKIVKL